MNGQVRAKVTARVDYDRRVRPPSPTKAYSRPPSPLKPSVSSISAPPTSRPKAKVSSSAAVRKVASPPAPGHIPGSQVGVPSARSPSPFKAFSGTQTKPTVPSTKAKVTGLARSNPTAIASAPSLPELRQRAITTIPGETSVRRVEHNRRGSISSQITSTAIGGARRTALSPPQSRNSSEDGGSVLSGGGGLRVKAKVSHITGHPSTSTHSLPPSPSYERQTRPRVPSVSKLSPSPPLRAAKANGSGNLSPISPAPTHHRFATVSDTASPRLHPPAPQQPRDDLAVDYTKHSITKVDPTQIPLPPQSPPSSTVSFSSRSSTSHSSVSYESHASDSSRSSVPTLNFRPPAGPHVNGTKHARSRSSIDGLGIQLSPLSREPSSQGTAVDEETHERPGEDKPESKPDRKLRDEAISNRKIADLEITNRSLLAINTTLEATKHRQAKEIRELRRRLRESILVLPPPAYRAAKTSLTQDGTLHDEEEEEDNDDDPEVQAILEGKSDEAYRRVKSVIETLIESGRRALASQPEDFLGTGTSGTKVLSEEEARTWRGEDLDSRSILEDGDTSSISQFENPSRPLSRGGINSDDLTSEDEVEASLVMYSDSESLASPLPPITVTPSPSL